MDADAAKRRKSGHKSKLSVEDALLLTLEYCREYRAYFRIGQNFVARGRKNGTL
jgi:hypothetical protein